MPATRFSHVKDSSFASEPLWDIWDICPRVEDEATLPLCNLVVGVPTDGPWLAWIALARERRRACDEHCAARPPIQPLGIAGASGSRPLRTSRLLC